LTRWFAEKGFGFITYDNGGKQIFVHLENLVLSNKRTISREQSKYLSLQVQKHPIKFSIGECTRGVSGKPQALNVRNWNENAIDFNNLFLETNLLAPTFEAKPVAVIEANVVKTEIPVAESTTESVKEPEKESVKESAAIPVLVIQRVDKSEKILFAPDLKSAICLASKHNNDTVSVAHLGIITPIPYSRFSAVSCTNIREFSSQEELDSYLLYHSTRNPDTYNSLADLVEFI
jgi:cold shock CspA family protein